MSSKKNLKDLNGHAFQTSRRKLLKSAGAGAAVLGLGAVGMGPFVRRSAFAADKSLRIVQWSHFVPVYDQWFDTFAKEWGAKNHVNVTIDHIPHLEIPARAAAEVAAQSGHDLFGFNGAGGPFLYRRHTLDMSAIVAEMEKKYGKASTVARGLAYDTELKRWTGFPDFYINFPGLYRKDLWDEIGMKPDTWEDLRVGGAKLKAKGNPVGIGLAHSVDPTLSWRGLLYSYGAGDTDVTGRKVTINSKETLEAIKFAKALYKEAMTPEVLSWDDASNNQMLQSGKACWIHNPISAYRSTQKTNPELADKIYVWKTPAGPVRRLCAGAPNAYVIWKFAKNPDVAKAFLRHYAQNWVDAYKASTGYNHPVFEHIVPKPMPILDNDPTSHPPDKLKVLETANDWMCIYGWPGPGTPAAAEVAGNYIIEDMIAQAATDKLSPEDALAQAEKAMKAIYDKWNAI
jgi:multiple sugar transport system substrate-binding protein